MSAAKKNREIARRKFLVAELLVTQQAKDMTCTEIAEALDYPRNSRGRIDRDRQSHEPNGKPWSKATIARDVQEIEEHWQTDALQTASTWKSKILAQYQELLERYWKTTDLEGVERVLAGMRKHIGTDNDQVVLFEQLQLQMAIAAQRLKAGLADRPEVANEAFRLLTGNPKANVFTVPDPQVRSSSPSKQIYL